MVKSNIVLSGRYEVISKIGAGGMADVYKGRDSMLNRHVAIKVLKKEYREDENFLKKFRSEAQAAAGLMNPNIVNVYDVGEDRGLHYMVMELVEGITLKDYIMKKGKLSTREVISIAIQMCTGIAAAHAHKIIHRDIKPQNIIISKDGKVKVTDFGIARAITSDTISSNAMGSVHYVSPEQARGGYCDEKSDIYSVGITMYEMVTGEVPFDGETTVSVAMKHLQENITPPSHKVPNVPRALEDIILKCTQKSSERRYADVAYLMRDLKRALVDPDGDFVDLGRNMDMGETVMISPEAMKKMKRDYTRDYDDDDYDEYDDDYDDDDYDEYDDEEDEYERKRSSRTTGRNGRGKSKTNDVDPRMNKMMKGLTIAAAVIIGFIVIFIVGNAVGILNFGPGSNVEETDSEKEIEVPDLIGEKEKVAEEICEKHNLVMKVVKMQHSDKYEAGYVIEQSYEPGEMVAKKTEIEVVISSGAEEVKVRDVSGMTEDEARDALKDQGFDDIEIITEYSEDVEQSQVIRTEPGANETVTVDTKITIVVSMGAEKKEVPKIEGLALDKAVKALKDAGLADGGYTEEYSSSVKKGYVISQSVKAGKQVEAGTKVSYVVSKGEKPAEQVSVPPLSGKSLSEAKKALSNVGLLYKETWVDSPVTYGTVIEANPESGTKVNVGSTIEILISLGNMDDEGDGSGDQQE